MHVRRVYILYYYVVTHNQSELIVDRRSYVWVYFWDATVLIDTWCTSLSESPSCSFGVYSGPVVTYPTYGLLIAQANLKEDVLCSHSDGSFYRIFAK